MGTDGLLTIEKVKGSTDKTRPSYIVSQNDITEDDRGKDYKTQ